MMHCPSIRKLTAAEREQRAELADERYEELTAQYEAEALHEYNEQFGPTYQAKHPFKLDTEALHDRIVRQMRAEGHDYNQSRAANEL